MDKSSMTLGLLIGRQIAGQRAKKREPIAYLYNGVQLPPLPEWDRETYPYAVMRTSLLLYAYTVYLYVSTVPIDVKVFDLSEVTGGLIQYSYYPRGDGSVMTFSCSEDTGDGSKDTEFHFKEETVVEGNKVFVQNTLDIGEPLWSNYDVLNYKDGTILLEASEPVPVYE